MTSAESSAGSESAPQKRDEATFSQPWDQGLQHVAIGGHQADGIKAMLPAQRLKQLDAGNLGDRVPLIRGLQRRGDQRFFADRLLSEFRVDAAATQKGLEPHPAAPGRFHHVGLDLEVIEQEISRVGVVGLDAAHPGRRRQHHHRGLVLFEPALHGGAVIQIQLGSAGCEQIAVACPLQRLADGAACHTAMARHEDAVGGGDQCGGGCHGCVQRQRPTRCTCGSSSAGS